MKQQKSCELSGLFGRTLLAVFTTFFIGIHVEAKSHKHSKPHKSEAKTKFSGSRSRASVAAGPQTLSLDDYLTQVMNKNDGIRAALIQADATLQHSDEADILTMPAAFVNVQYTNDARLQPPVIYSYTSQTITTVSAGVAQNTSFGLAAKLHYDISTVNVNGANISPALQAAFGAGIPFAYANSATVLELSQSLWGNGFGKSTRAKQHLNEAQVLATHYGAKFQAKATLAQAESQYWRLSLARQAVHVHKEALDRARKIYEWNVKRSDKNLGEHSDVLQSQALMQARDLELTAALNEERSAARAFNSSRSVESEQVSEELTQLTPSLIDKIEVPKRAKQRDDVKSAEQQMKAAVANSDMLVEGGRPTLELFGMLALNGQAGNNQVTDVQTNLGDSVAKSFSFNRPTEVVGIRFQAPLAIGLAQKARQGWFREQEAAEVAYQRKLFEQDRSWTELTANYADTRKQLALAQQLEKTQEEKLETERSRLLKGRSTTYQVLLFETDFLLSQLNRIKTQASIFTILANMKLFSDNSGEAQ